MILNKELKTKLGLSSLFLLLIVSANVSVGLFGPSAMFINSFLFIGLDMVCRDLIHDRLSGKLMLFLVLAGGVLSYLVSPSYGSIAIASSVSFVVSMLVNYITYHFLKGKDWMVKSNSSNLAGSVTDSVLFPYIAFGGFDMLITIGQILAKFGGGLFWSSVVKSVR